MKNKNLIAWALLILLAIIWGSSPILIKKALIKLDPFEIGALRLTLASFVLFPFLAKNLKEISYTNFNFKVNISKQKYVRMIKERYISCLLNMSKKEIKYGISEIKSKYKDQIKFTDTLRCISYRK